MDCLCGTPCLLRQRWNELAMAKGLCGLGTLAVFLLAVCIRQEEDPVLSVAEEV